MKEICAHNICTGCSACFNICPKECIEMTPMDEDGRHIYPVIDENRCINCNLCVKVCPNNTQNEFNTPSKVYAAWAKNINEYTSSASGGVAAIFSRMVISQGGVVYGCTSDKVNAFHIRIERETDIYKLKGSKYVQSNINDVYRLIKKDLLKDRLVLFFGTPCQVAGLKGFLQKPYEKLLSVDLVCHGVPSQRMLQEHAKDVLKDNIRNFSFRDMNGYNMKFYGEHNDYYKTAWDDRYFATFLAGITCRNSCYSCQYARPERISDITIGDFWELGKSIPFNVKVPPFGVSLILFNTDKVLNTLKDLEKYLYIYERNYDEALTGNPQLCYPMKKSFQAKIFRILYPRASFKCASRIALLDRRIRELYFVLLAKSKHKLKRLLDKCLQKITKG